MVHEASVRHGLNRDQPLLWHNTFRMPIALPISHICTVVTTVVVSKGNAFSCLQQIIYMHEHCATCQTLILALIVISGLVVMPTN